MNLKPLLTVAEIAQILQIKEMTLYRQIWNGRDTPPYIKIGRAIRFREDDVISWLDRASNKENCRDKPAGTNSSCGVITDEE